MGTLGNAELSDSWSVTIGACYVVSKELTLTVCYGYLNRIVLSRSNTFTVDGGFYW